jgi:hypothetical protein
MNNKDLVVNLKRIAKLFSDAAWNYERALNKIEDEDLRLELMEMHDEHMEQMENLNGYIKQLGENPPKFVSIGEMSKELIPVTDDMSSEEIIKALRNNEKIISGKLQSLADEVQIPEIARDLEDDIDDEKTYIDTLRDYMS